MSELPRIGIPKEEWVGEIPFGRDTLGRKAIADRLTSYIDRLKIGSVIAIDAPWGQGKSYFGRNWAAQLSAAGHKVAFIDAFEQDYIEDPFLLIAAEIAELISEDEAMAEDFRDGAVGVMKAMLPVATKTLIGMAGRFVLGNANIADDVTEALKSGTDDVADASEAWIKERLDSHAKEKIAFKSFKNALDEFAGKQSKPVVVFVDELDRCRPNYAVSLIERLKHLFDVPNLVFVILINRTQLERAVKGIYGPDTDAELYISKFINLSFTLPVRRSAGSGRIGQAGKYIQHIVNKYDFKRDDRVGCFIDGLEDASCIYELSLRDIEKCVALFACAQPSPKGGFILAYLICLKVVRPNVFDGLLNGLKKTHELARAELSDYLVGIPDQSGGRSWRLKVINEWHVMNIMPGYESEHAKDFMESEQIYGYSLIKVIESLLTKIDLFVD